MIFRCAEVLVAWLIQYDAINSDDRELYEYAVYSILFTVSPLLLAGMIGFMIGRIGECIVVILPFMFIRKFSGGYHAKKAWVCFIISSVLLVLCTLMSSYIKFDYGLVIVMVIAMVSLMVCSPVDSENRRLSREEKKCCKIATIIIALIFLGIDLILYLCQQETYAICISIGIILAAGLQIPCIFRMINSK
ncbi:MAG: accessory gene regulator B family protein [Lachnospiraceae bacterium]|nr:accessory gene regulator B family protein [Lachnospiraceae bacterium]